MPLRAALASLSVFVLAALTAAAPAAAQAPPYPWKDAAPFPRPMGELYAATVGDTIYVFGGLAPGLNAVGLVYAYDPAANAWTQKRPMPHPAHHIMLAPYDGKIYVFGGFDHLGNDPYVAWHPISNSWAYDPATDTWKALAPMPTPRGAGQAVEVGGKIYVIGGANSGIPGHPDRTVYPTGPDRVVGTCEVYTVASNSWGTCADMPTARNHYVAAAVNGKIYAIDGRIGAVYIAGPGPGFSGVTDLIEAYDPATNRWSDVGRSPMPRGDVSGAVYNGRICIGGGELGTTAGKMAYWAFECYDPGKPAYEAWQELPHMQIPRHGFAAAVVGDTFHAIGGSFQSDGIPEVSSFTANHEVYTFAP
jgi:N-acetylneuraminic acid mutarotase